MSSIVYKYYRAYAYETNTLNNKTIESYLLRLKSLETAQNAKLSINNKLRSLKSNSSIEYNYSLYILIASNLDIHYKDIFCIYNNLPHTSSFDNLSEKYDYDDLVIDEKDRIKIHRIKQKVLSTISSGISYSDSKGCLLSYLKSIDYRSFTSNQLDIYINAIVYLRSSTTFELYDGSIIDLTWINAISNQSIKRTQMKFLSRFSNNYSLSRNVVERYLKTFNQKECFSIDDIDIIITTVTSRLGIKYTESDFFNDLEIIKNCN